VNIVVSFLKCCAVVLVTSSRVEGLHQTLALRMRPLYYLWTRVTNQPQTQCNISDGPRTELHRCESLKPRIDEHQNIVDIL
jgi:hypothetical protein